MKGNHTHSLDQIEGSRLLQRVDKEFTEWQKSKISSGSKPLAGNLLSYDGDTLNVKSLEIGDIAALNVALNNKAAADHTHTGYAATNHSHSIGGITGLQAALDGKSNTDHTHPSSGESEIIVRLGADVANATTSFADVTGLLFPVLANKDYVFDVWLLFQSSVTTTGIKLAVNGPAGFVVLGLQTHIPTTLTAITHGCAVAYNSGTASAGVPVINTSYLANITGIFRNGATAGNLVIRFAAETTGTVKIMTGSILRYRQVN
ncbi:MAG: hypothetical protein WC495_03115 [Patescibacteria group bacterium]